jgi:hypothetical protein
MMTRDHIINEIQRGARENGGKVLGWRRFSAETGMKESDLHENGWARYSEACRDAGFIPNKMTEGYNENELLARYVEVARGLGRLPTESDLHVVRSSSDFPYDRPFRRAFPGGKRALVGKLAEYCRDRAEHGDVLRWCTEYLAPEVEPGDAATPPTDEVGFVYLMRSGRFYKIGCSNSVGRREYELAIQLPERVRQVHVIRTDDPFGIEAYWHNRFRDRRKNGEWFDLTPADVSAFKRRKFM